MNELFRLSAVELIGKIRSGNVSVTEIASLTLTRFHELQHLNTLVNTNENAVMVQARHLDKLRQGGNILPLHGLPIVIKDNIDTKDFITTGGTPALAHNQPQNNANVVQELVDAGALLIAKANLDELAGGVTGNNAFSGAIHNPYNTEFTAGGSSGGTAAAISAHLIPVGLGTDTGGSVRIPASLCGICGFRPTVGRYASDGVIGMPRSRATIGTFARAVEDLALLDELVSKDPSHASVNLADLRFGLPRLPFFEDIDSGTEKLMHETIGLLRSAGVTIIEKDFPRAFELNDKISFPIALYEARVELEKYVAAMRVPIILEKLIDEMATPDIKQLMSTVLHDVARADEDYQHAVQVLRPQLFQAYDAYFDDDNLDAMIYPTTLTQAVPIGQDEHIEVNGKQIPTFQAYARNSDPGANARVPSLSMPIAMTDEGMPVGMSIDAKRGNDKRLLAVSTAVKTLLPAIPVPALL